jgi:Family of unknown function (DUF6459)
MTASTSAPEQIPPAARPPLRLVVVPTPQPPLEDEGLPLRLVLPGVASPRPAHRPGPRPHTSRTTARPDDDFGPSWSVRADLPDARDAGRRLITCTLEALAGRRPIAQVQSMTSLRVFTALVEGRRPRWCTEGTAPLLVGLVHVCEPVDGVAEISAVARRGGRAHAVAARLEGIDGRWRCTALQIG